MAVFLSLKVLDTSSLHNPAVCTYTTVCSTLLPYLDIEHAEAELHFRPCREFANGTVYPTTATHAEWLVCTYISEKRRKLSEGDHIRRDLNRSHNERSRIICSLMCVRETCHSKFVIFRQTLHITDRLQLLSLWLTEHWQVQLCKIIRLQRWTMLHSIQALRHTHAWLHRTMRAMRYYRMVALGNVVDSKHFHKVPSLPWSVSNSKAF